MLAWVVFAVAAAIVTGGFAVSLLPDSGLAPASIVPAPTGSTEEKPGDLANRFSIAVGLLRSGSYEQAAITLHAVLTRAPEMPEAHVNMGYALLGLRRYDAARGFFEAASALRPSQANAYYGLAVALRELDDLPGAIGAMRTYVHLTAPEDTHLDKARAALLQWDAQLAAQRGSRFEAISGPHRGNPE